MSRSLRRGALAATIAVVLPLAAGCASGKDAETNEIKPDTASTAFGSLKIQNVQLVTGDPGKHLVALGGALFNEGTKPETITKVTVDGAGQALGGPLTIPAGGAVYMVNPPKDVAPDSPLGKTFLGPLVFPDAAKVEAGSFRRVTFAFGTAGETSLDVSVHSPTSYYAQLKPTPAFTPPPPAPPTSAAPVTGAATVPPANSTGNATTPATGNTGAAGSTPPRNSSSAPAGG
ncbi:hypothetical protein [Embleya scabrispora]|uniref:hypothetical protein n=1 Tax=Embleya scabrispora TaxID=159449 RepID=UPI00037AAEFF|nr:hypothetical protein [Embleya scabrispora]MYS79888.1 hypothetical protein [Streptomyces sp. SID5474]